MTTARMPADPTGDIAGYDHCWADGVEGLGWVNRTDPVACTTNTRTLFGARTTSEDDTDSATDADCGGGFCGESNYLTSEAQGAPVLEDDWGWWGDESESVPDSDPELAGMSYDWGCNG